MDWGSDEAVREDQRDPETGSRPFLSKDKIRAGNICNSQDGLFQGSLGYVSPGQGRARQGKSQRECRGPGGFSVGGKVVGESRCIRPAIGPSFYLMSSLPFPPSPVVPPLPTLNLGPALEEGQGRTLAASCTAEGSPMPNVTWDTVVKGSSTRRFSSHPRSASVTSEFYLVPSRTMNGQPITCVVSHPGLPESKRITHTLQVAFLAEASVWGHEDPELWHVGREGVMLKCLSEGQPPPSYNWTRLDRPLPSGVRVDGGTLGFPPLTPEHSGTYVCHVSNEVSSRNSQVTVAVTAENEAPPVDVDVVSASMVAVGVIAGLLLCLLVVVVLLMSRYHRRKAQQMTQKYEEELTLTRENSIRRLHSHHSEPRNQSEEPEGRSYSTLTTVREIETQTELLSPGSGRTDEEEDRDAGIKQAMNHFVQENGTLRAKPTGNGIYINGRGHLV
uniref:Nectin-4 n=1 Tax=Monodelphis domestica TaxID=13616 RepID=A0A5F8G4Q7_MONDO